MGGFTNEELDDLNLGKNYKYPDTTQIENKASTILPTTDDDTVFKFTVSVLFLMSMVNPEIILKAATININISMMNITFLSTFKALKKDLFKSDQV